MNADEEYHHYYFRPVRRRLMRSSGGGAFDLLSLAPRVWLAASTLVLDDADPVAAWTDQSGNGADATQSNAGNRPVFKTGQTPAGGPCVRFTASSSTYLNLAYDGEPATFFFVCRKSASAVGMNESMLSADTDDVTDLAAYYIKPKGTGAVGGGAVMEIVRATNANGNATATAAVGNWPGQWLVMAGTFTDAGATIYLNGQRVFFGTAEGARRPIKAGSAVIGAEWFGNSLFADFNGDIAEIVICDTALTQSQILQATQYLADEAGITLPGTGPAALPAYVFPTFNGTTETLRLLHSTDGLTFTEARTELVPSLGSVRDPSLFVWEGFYWIVYTLGSFDTSTSFGVAKASDWRGPYTWVTNVDCSSISGVNRVWSPISFIDPADNSLHVLFSASANGNSGPFVQYHIEPTDLTGLTTWGSPAAIGGVADSYPNTIAGFIIRKSGTYYLWVKDESDVGSGGKYNVILSSSSPFSGYTPAETGDWAGWGQNTYEGVYPVQIDAGTWRAYMDHYIVGGRIEYSTSTDDWATWSAPTTITAPLPVTRNGVILYTP